MKPFEILRQLKNAYKTVIKYELITHSILEQYPGVIASTYQLL